MCTVRVSADTHLCLTGSAFMHFQPCFRSFQGCFFQAALEPSQARIFMHAAPGREGGGVHDTCLLTVCTIAICMADSTTCDAMSCLWLEVPNSGLCRVPPTNLLHQRRGVGQQGVFEAWPRVVAGCQGCWGDGGVTSGGSGATNIRRVMLRLRLRPLRASALRPTAGPASPWGPHPL